MQSQLVSAHGMLAILEVLESRIARDVALKLLQIINAVSGSCVGGRCVLTLIGGFSLSQQIWGSSRASVSLGAFQASIGSGPIDFHWS